METHPRGPLALVTSPLPRFTDHVFWIFDRAVCSGVQRQDQGASSRTFASINGTATKPSGLYAASRPRLFGYLIPCLGNGESSAGIPPPFDRMKVAADQSLPMSLRYFMLSTLARTCVMHATHTCSQMPRFFVCCFSSVGVGGILSALVGGQIPMTVN
ncbi:hypothetical protein EI94DRAFT_259310 [Lactarius quietus]|nr:hypothetical protein EI94DRAFT_259310 [Lactarius quietus]